jgi:hypothetical protein
MEAKMPSQQSFTGNSFLTLADYRSEPVWQPLEDVARLVWQRPELPQFHPCEFMYMAAVQARRRAVTIHLYKHIDTRHYLNLDDGGHAYAYQPRVGDPRTPDSGGRYRRYRDLVTAIDRLELHEFETINLFRSFPPEEWPGIEAERRAAG